LARSARRDVRWVAAVFAGSDEIWVRGLPLFSEAFRRFLLQSGGANIAGADRAWQAAAFLTRSQTKNVSARSLVQTAARDPISQAPPLFTPGCGPASAGRLVFVMDPRELYTLNEAVVAKLKDHRPVMIHQLDGFVDAGQAGRLFSANLLENLEHEVLADFDHDQLHDYRSRRPAMIFDTNQWKSYADLHLRIYRVTDGHGEVFLLFSGPEPDVQWERLAAAVVGLIEQLGVRMTVGVHGIPMAVPHTRPITLTAHATDPALVKSYRSWIDRVEVPASFTGLLEFRLGQLDRKAMGFAAHVPHYLAQASFPEATLTLTRSLNQATGLAVPVESLEKASASNLADIAEEMATSTEVQELVATLEQQYDALQAEQQDRVPSAEEIAAEFERFLAEREKDD
jgi:predicted ATP-grasp superfamily ATP-dependent carboligase